MIQMQSQEVLVHYILHNNMIINRNFIVDNPNNQFLGNNSKVQILGKLNKRMLLSDIRGTYEWDKSQILFIKKTKNRPISLQDQKPTEKYEFVNTNGQFSIKLMQIFDYSASIKAISQQKDLRNTQFTQFYLIHLFTSPQNNQSSIVRKINLKRQDFFYLPKRPPGIMLFSSNKIDQMKKEMSDKIDKNFWDSDQKIKNLIEGQKTIANNSKTGTFSPSANPGPSGNVQPPTNPSNVPQGPPKPPPANNDVKTSAPQLPPTTSLPPSNNSDSNTRKSQRITTKEQIESTLRLAKVTHRSFHKGEQIKQRSIVDFSNSKIDLINAYKNFFYEKQVILKDETQAKYLKESLNTVDFSLDVGAPSSALDTKIGMALLRTNSLSQQSYLRNEQFSQVHIAYSFQEAFQILPENIMLNLNLRNYFKKIFVHYVVLSKAWSEQDNFFDKSISEVPQIKEQLQLFFTQYGSELQTGVFVFGGKYMAETSFKFIQNLDLKSKEKVRNAEGKFTIQGGYANLKPGIKVQDRERQQDHVATENAIVSRSYMLFPGSSKNLTEWNNSLENSREDWKMILKNTKNVFIGEILANPLNSEEYKLIDIEAFGNFSNKLKEYFDDISNKNQKKVDQGLQEYKKNRLFTLWKQDIIKNLRVIKLTPLESNQPIRQIEKPIKTSNTKTITDRRLISEQELQDISRQASKSKKTRKQQNSSKGCFSSKKPSFYILLRGKQINEAYKSILGDSSEYQERRQIYDSRIEKLFFKYICCCFLEKKPQMTQVEIKRKKYIKLFSDEQNQKLLNQNDLQIYNIEIQNQYKRLRQANEFKLPSQIISSSPKIKHIFDISEQNFKEGLIENLIFRTTPEVDCLNRSGRHEIYFEMEFMSKRKGLINLLENGQQEHVIVRVQNIRKVNLVGEVLQENVGHYGDLFYNRANHEHFMLIQRLANIGH